MFVLVNETSCLLAQVIVFKALLGTQLGLFAVLKKVVFFAWF